MLIAVDFDGTIVENIYPEIGEEIPFAFECLKKIQKIHQYRLILWSSREGPLLQDAVDFCKKRGLEFYAINKNNPEDLPGSGPRKIVADVFIDDSNLGGIPDWKTIYKMIISKSPLNNMDLYRNFFGNELSSHSFMIATVSGYQTLCIDDIIMFEYIKSNKYWYVYLKNQAQLHLKRSTNAETILGYSSSFVQINQQQIINVKYLSMINGKKCILFQPIDNENNLIISRNCMKGVQDRFQIV
jgi:LytTr DNA-binding domain.